MPDDVERLFMEPLDTDMDYVVREPRPMRAETRMNVLFILPIIGGIIMLTFISAALFQIDLSGVVDTLMGLMIVFFFIFIALLFWGMAPRARKS
jgi:hypothetical protein